MAYENTGYLAFANALSNAGQTFGNALTQRYEQEKKQQYLADLAPMAKEGNWAGISEIAFQRGDADLGIKALAQAQEQKKLAEQRAFDAQAFGLANGGGASTGVTGGVTPNPNQQPTQLPGGSYGVSQAYDLIKKVGGTDEEARTLAAISQPESSGNPMAHNQRGPDDSYGLWQINMRGGLGPERMKQFGLSKPEDLYNPETNAKAALALARLRGGYGDWSTYNSGKHQPYLQNGQPVQVADASGAIPVSAMQGQSQQGQQPSPVDGLMSRRQNILRALQSPSISDNARQQLNTLLKDTEFQIERIDKQAQNANQSLSPYEKTRQEQQAKSEVEQSQQKAQQARSVDVIMPQLDRAEAAYKALAERKAIGPMMSSGLNRTLEASIPVEKWNQDEGLRQDFEAAQKELELYKAQISMKGQGQITESERKLLGLTLPRLDAAKPETGLETLRIMRDTMNKIKQDSGAQPSLNKPSAYDAQKAREALAAGRSQQEVTDFLRSKGMSADGLF